jgi:hypothetical protein
MSQGTADGPAAKLWSACDLFDSGVAMMRETLRRKLPAAPERAIADALDAWLRERPGAEHGDAPGVCGSGRRWVHEQTLGAAADILGEADRAWAVAGATLE